MLRDLYRKLSGAFLGFASCQKGVTAIEYAVVAVGIAAVVAAAFNPSSGPLYDVLMQAMDSIVASIEENI